MNETWLQGFEWYLPADGEHWNRLAQAAPELARAGFTGLWLPPAYKGASGKNDVGYGVYDLYDLGEFDQKGSVATKYGNRDQYLAAVRALKQNGIKPIADVVLNHRMGADECEDVQAAEVNSHDRWQKCSGEESVSVWTRFTFPGRNGKYSSFIWDWSCFDGVDWDERTKRNVLLLLDGKEWEKRVDAENGNYDYLMGADIDLSSPKVYRELLEWGKWYVNFTGVEGLRLDAVKHMDRAFYLRWLEELRRATGKPLPAVGEYWSYDLKSLLNYLGGERTMSLFDVPLHARLRAASCSQGSQDMSAIFDGTLVSCHPEQAVTFVDNHDTQPGQALESFVEPWFKPLAYALILLRQDGLPCVFYGDWYGIPHDRRDPVKELPLLVTLRARCAYGVQHDFLDQPDCIGWTREGDAAMPDSGLAVLMTDGGENRKEMYVGREYAGEIWLCVLGSQPPVTIDSEGLGVFQVSGGGLSVYLRPGMAEKLAEAVGR